MPETFPPTEPLSPSAPAEQIVVVGVAIVVDGRVLTARRTRPAALAGGWELPGGKVEPGEDPARTAVREVAEELGCTVEVTGWLTASSRIDERHVLRVALARLVAGEPEPTEHDRVCWLGAGELEQVDWLAPDRPFLAELGRRIAAP